MVLNQHLTQVCSISAGKRGNLCKQHSVAVITDVTQLGKRVRQSIGCSCFRDSRDDEQIASVRYLGEVNAGRVCLSVDDDMTVNILTRIFCRMGFVHDFEWKAILPASAPSICSAYRVSVDQQCRSEAREVRRQMNSGRRLPYSAFVRCHGYDHNSRLFVMLQ